MSRAAVLGRPVAHSLSPLLHRAAYAALGLTDWTYDALDIGAEDLPVLLAGLGRGVARLLGDHAVQAGGGGRRRRRRAAAAAAARGEHAGPHRRGLAGREHRRRRHRHGAAAGRGRAGRRAPRSSAPGGRRRPRPWRWRRWAPEHVDVVVRDPSRAGDVTRVLDVLGVPATVTPLAGRRRWTRRWSSAPCPIDAQPGLLRPAVAGRADRARRAVRALADAAGRSGSPPPAAPSSAASRCCSGRPPSRWS